MTKIKTATAQDGERTKGAAVFTVDPDLTEEQRYDVFAHFTGQLADSLDLSGRRLVLCLYGAADRLVAGATG